MPRSRLINEKGLGPWTDYFLNNYINDDANAEKPNGADKKRSLVAITDGTSNTVFLGEGNVRTTQYKDDAANVTLSTNIFKGGTLGTMRSGKNGQTDPKGDDPPRCRRSTRHRQAGAGPFPQGALMAMGDGSVRMFSYSTNNFSVHS